METRFNAVMKELDARGYEVRAHEVSKNGVIRKGLVIKGESNIAPVIYIDQIPGDYIEVADTVEEIFKRESNHKMDFSWFAEWESVKDTLVIGVRKVIDDGAVTRPLLDLEIYVKSIVNGFSGTGAIKVLKNHIDMWGIDEDELIDTALNNDAGLRLFDMVEKVPIFEAGVMWLVTNKDDTNGAAALALPEVFKEFAQEHKKDLYILPSSIHEVIVIFADDEKASDLASMVKEINATTVEPEDFLSDSVYRYNRSNGNITKC